MNPEPSSISVTPEWEEICTDVACLVAIGGGREAIRERAAAPVLEEEPSAEEPAGDDELLIEWDEIRADVECLVTLAGGRDATRARAAELTAPAAAPGEVSEVLPPAPEDPPAA